MKKLFWISTNLYGKLLGHAFMAPFHHAVVSFSLHALGYGNMLREEWTGEEWFIKKVLAPTRPKMIFDVGANVGNYSKLLLKYTDAKIYAFEPNPSSFSMLSKLDERVTKVQKAVSNSSGSATLYFKFDYDGKASLDANIRRGNEVSVELTTLERYAIENNIPSVDYIKIDTEGFERDVLEGLGSLRPQYIQFEFNINHLQRNHTLRSITELLPNYRFYRLLPNGWVKIDAEHYLDNVFIFSNVIAVRD